MNLAESIERIEYHNSRIQALKQLSAEESREEQLKNGTSYAILYNYKGLVRSVGANYGVFEKYFGPNTYRFSDKFVDEDFILRCEGKHHLLMRELPKVEKFANYIAIAKEEITKNKERQYSHEGAISLERIENLRLVGYEEVRWEKAYNDGSKTDEHRLLRTVQSARYAQLYVAHGKTQFEQNLCLQEAIYRNMQRIGNYVDNLSPKTKQLNPSAWKDQLKYCDRLTNNELIDPKSLWRDANKDLPALLDLLDGIKEKVLRGERGEKESKKVIPFKQRSKESEIDRLI